MHLLISFPLDQLNNLPGGKIRISADCVFLWRLRCIFALYHAVRFSEIKASFENLKFVSSLSPWHSWHCSSSLPCITVLPLLRVISPKQEVVCLAPVHPVLSGFPCGACHVEGSMCSMHENTLSTLPGVESIEGCRVACRDEAQCAFLTYFAADRLNVIK